MESENLSLFHDAQLLTFFFFNLEVLDQANYLLQFSS